MIVKAIMIVIVVATAIGLGEALSQIPILARRSRTTARSAVQIVSLILAAPFVLAILTMNLDLHRVKIEVSGGSTGCVQYTYDGEARPQQEELSLPWSAELQVEDTESLTVLAGCGATQCVITVDGRIVLQKSASATERIFGVKCTLFTGAVPPGDVDYQGE